jgi:hypothetical protein
MGPCSEGSSLRSLPQEAVLSLYCAVLPPAGRVYRPNVVRVGADQGGVNPTVRDRLVSG